MSAIKYPEKHDVMLGRGGESNYHSGNIAFRQMVQKYKGAFRHGSRKEKELIIDQVVDEWRNHNPPGRFLAKYRTEIGEILWGNVSDNLARKRAYKSLSECIPKKSSIRAREFSDDMARGQVAQQLHCQAVESASCQQQQALPTEQYVGWPRVEGVQLFPQPQYQQQHQQLKAQEGSQSTVYNDCNSDQVSQSIHETIGRKLPDSIVNNQQLCSFIDTKIGPLESARAVLPTAAELSHVFSDDEELSCSGCCNSSHSSHNYRTIDMSAAVKQCEAYSRNDIGSDSSLLLTHGLENSIRW